MEHFHSTAAHPEHPGHAAAHGPHGHVHESQKAVVNRLARAIGHLEKVKRMVESGIDCSEVHRLQVQLQMGQVKAGDLKKFVDQPLQPLRFAQGDAGIFGPHGRAAKKP